MNQIKVTNTQQYSDSEDEHIVCQAKLNLVESIIFQGSLCRNEEGNICFPENTKTASKWLIPILVSETEEIEEGDKALYKDSSGYLILTLKAKDADRYWWEDNSCSRVENEVYKILALPENFSNKHLQDIVDGELGDGDKVLIKCVSIANVVDHPLGPLMEYNEVIDVDDQNRITLFPAQPSLEEVLEQRYPHTGNIADMIQTRRDDFTEGAEWAKKNNY